MTDELVKRHVEQLRMTGGDLADLCRPLADAIEALIAERDGLLRCVTDNHVALCRAEKAEAERDRLREAARFKPLVWFEAELPSRGGGKITAEGYTIRRIEGLWLLDFAGESKSVWRWADLQAAKAAAQADYEARILSALETEAQPDAEKLQ